MKPPSEDKIRAVDMFNSKNGHQMPYGVWLAINQLCNYARTAEPKLEKMREFAKFMNELAPGETENA